MDDYVKRFHEKVMGSCTLLPEKVLVDGCPDDMKEDCKIYLSFCHFYFSQVNRGH